MSLCPHCKKDFHQVTLSAIQVVHPTKIRHGVSYDCPHCGVSLSVEIDPIAVKTEIVAEIKAPNPRQSSYR